MPTQAFGGLRVTKAASAAILNHGALFFHWLGAAQGILVQFVCLGSRLSSATHTFTL